MQKVGILGGTFDPIHYGHLRLALAATEQLGLDQVRLTPVHIPPHRSLPIASNHHRQKMLELVLDKESKLCLDRRELESNDVSYTINTLKSLRQEYKHDALCLIVGRDAFNKIDTWKDWEQILDYAHIIVANRPGEYTNNISTILKDLVAKHLSDDLSVIDNEPNGKIIFIEIPMLDISSSQFRKNYNTNKPVNDLLPPQILNYIKHNHLYLDTA